MISKYLHWQVLQLDMHGSAYKIQLLLSFLEQSEHFLETKRQLSEFLRMLGDHLYIQLQQQLQADILFHGW